MVLPGCKLAFPYLVLKPKLHEDCTFFVRTTLDLKLCDPARGAPLPIRLEERSYSVGCMCIEALSGLAAVTP